MKPKKTVLEVLADMSGLQRTVRFRNLHADFTCVTGIGSHAWDRLFPGKPRPKELHPFIEMKGAKYTAPSTPGDLLFHIRASQMYMCFEMAMLIMDRLRAVTETQDEVHGFKYFDDRDLLGFVDGTANPEGPYAVEATMIGEEDPEFVNGSYVIVQKYMHDLKTWNELPVEMQEKIIGRKKLSNVELPDDEKPPYAHNVLNVVVKDGKQIDILRDNMPFGEVGDAHFGTYYIGYAKSAATTEEMLHNMFIGKPVGNYDHILDFSTAKTGCLFFVPTEDFLNNVKA
ncbi:Dyp-type peroxidase [Oecophyllibacter saccharovorans]|uniref:Dyp-type peroxidase n=1 Tax=Oecophyllibacter saccharovorans TaxID=2558360 RepID=UPI001E2D105C|nr:Dyp-type peroxidase [Oecophyllibacter saccharovorans]